MKWIALKPPVRFAYFPSGKLLWFANFASKEERIANGLAAFDMAAHAGWDYVENRLASYRVLPEEAFQTPELFYRDLVKRVARLA